MTKIEKKNNDRILAWVNNAPFAENARSKPAVPDLTVERVMAEYTPRYTTDFGQFFTPAEIARDLVGMLPLDGCRILEPAAGIGHLIDAAEWRYGQTFQMDAFEIDKECFAIGKKLFPWVNWRDGDVFAEVESGAYDVVIMNPPFGMTAGMGYARDSSPLNFRKSEHLFLELAYRAVKPNGVILMVFPPNMYNNLTKTGKAWFDRCMVVSKVESCWGKFKGTNMSAEIYYINRNDSF